MLQNLGQPEKSEYSQKHDFLIRIHLVSEEKVVVGHPRNEIKHKVKVLDVMHCDFSAWGHYLVRLWVKEFLEKIENNIKEENDNHGYVQPKFPIIVWRSERCVKSIWYYEINGTHNDYYIEYPFPNGVLFDHQRIEEISECVYIFIGILYILCQQ